MKKDYLEIILEDMNSKFDLVLEGHAALDKKIDVKFDELSEKIELNSFKIDTLNKKMDAVDERLSKKIDAVDEKLSKKIDAVDEKLSQKIDAVAADLKAHRADTEAHGDMYCVKEG